MSSAEIGENSEENKEASCWKSFKSWILEEFSFEKLSLVVACPQRFVGCVSSKDTISGWYLLLRLFLALLFSSFVLLDFLTESRRYYHSIYTSWFIYATNWGYISLCLYFLLSAINTTNYFIQQRRNSQDSNLLKPDDKPFDFLVSLQFLLHSVTCNCNIVISVVFHSAYLLLDCSAGADSILSSLKHSLNSVIVLSDLVIISIPIHLTHFLFPLIAATSYSLFTFLVYNYHFPAEGLQDYLRHSLNWRSDPINSTLTCLAVVSMTIPVQVLLYLIFQIKMTLFEKALKKNKIEGGAFSD